jgi:4'-phosphopantetheinyl transferase
VVEHLAPASLDGCTVDVWWADLAALADAADTLRGLLSDDERARADRFRHERDRRSFVVARCLLRRLLARELGIEPHALVFRYGPHGKPSLAGRAGETLHFSVAHAHDRALYALTRGRGRAIGVDVERISVAGSDSAIAEQFFAPEEVTSLAALPSSEQPAAFFTLWTLKEAYLKATGAGLSQALDGFAVRHDPVAATWRLYPAGSPRPDDSWALRSLPCEPGYAAAVAVTGPIARLTIRRWPALPAGG